jgi:hypothetical protein
MAEIDSLIRVFLTASIALASAELLSEPAIRRTPPTAKHLAYFIIPSQAKTYHIAIETVKPRREPRVVESAARREIC